MSASITSLAVRDSSKGKRHQRAITYCHSNVFWWCPSHRIVHKYVVLLRLAEFQLKEGVGLRVPWVLRRFEKAVTLLRRLGTRRRPRTCMIWWHWITHDGVFSRAKTDYYRRFGVAHSQRLFSLAVAARWTEISTSHRHLLK
jgi:hypothetical protein